MSINPENEAKDTSSKFSAHKCDCLSISDFRCHCKGKFQYYCFSHAKSHFLHKDIRLILNSKTIKKIPEMSNIITEKINQLNEFKENANKIAKLCIDNINRVLENSLNKFDHMISNLVQALVFIQDEDINNSKEFLGLHKYFFTESFTNLTKIIGFTANYNRFSEYCDNLFEIDDLTDLLIKPFGKFPLDEEFYINELNRLTKLKVLKRAKKMDKTNKFVKDIYTSGKARVSNLGITFLASADINAINLICAFSKILKKSHIITIANSKYSDSQFAKIVEFLNNYREISPILHLVDLLSSESQIEYLI